MPKLDPECTKKLEKNALKYTLIGSKCTLFEILYKANLPLGTLHLIRSDNFVVKLKDGEAALNLGYVE